MLLKTHLQSLASPSLAVSWGARCLVSCSWSVSLSVSNLLPLKPCTAMPSPTVQTVSPMSVLGPLHGPRSSVQCTLLVSLCVSGTWVVLASFKDCFATCYLMKKRKLFSLTCSHVSNASWQLGSENPLQLKSQLSWLPGTLCSFSSSLQMVLFDHFAATQCR